MNKKPVLTSCSACNKEVSSDAINCPHCGHQLKRAKRGIFGKLFLWIFILFNIIMAFWLFSYLGIVGEAVTDNAVSEAEQAGAAIGGTIGTGFLVSVWGFGAVILGIIVLLTKPKYK